MRLEPDQNISEANRKYDARKSPRISLPKTARSQSKEARSIESKFVCYDPLLNTLERVGCGGIMRDRFRRVTAINLTARRILEQDIEARDLNREGQISHAVDRLLNRASARLPADEMSWVTVHRESGRPLAIYQLPIAAPPESAMLILVDMDTYLQPRSRTLQRMFGLTKAELKLASAIASGFTPTDLAREWRISRATVRSQLASIFAKTHTHRQAELVALLARVSLLP